MSGKLINTFFNEHSQHLNDVYGINYVQNYDQHYGWTDLTAMFVDSIMLWCAYDMQTDENMVVYYLSIIRATFVRFFESHQFKLKVARKGKWESFDDASVNMEGQQSFSDIGYIGINATFHGIAFSALFGPLNKALEQLLCNSIILRSIDVTVDCGYISTRSIIEKYIISHNIATRSDIVHDRLSVGDNCISFLGKSLLLNNANTRTKIYNKFVQALESSQLLEALGSRLSHLVADHDASYMEKLRHFLDTGYTRIEMSIYGSTLFHPTSYERAMDDMLSKLARCPTFKVPLREQWHMIVDKLTQVTAVYIEETSTFAYCHWWNSLTKRKQGICRDIKADDLQCHLANFSFNDRTTHCFYIKQIGSSSSYVTIKHEQYMRAAGCTEMTLVPGKSNTLFPSRYYLPNAIMFADVGLDVYNNVRIDWPSNRLDMTASKCVAHLVRIDEEAFDMTSIREALLPSLEVVDSPQGSAYRSDYSCLVIGTTYRVIKYGYANFRGKMCLHLVFDSGLSVRCGSALQEIVEPKLQENTVFNFTVTNVSTRRVLADIV
jgi:hypothetical protein